MSTRIVYCVSDHTGVTVEAVAKSVLSQFPGFECSRIVLPFVDSVEKAREAAGRIAATPGALVFSTLTDPAARAVLREAGAPLFDAFELIAPAVEAALGQPAVPGAGHTHGMAPDYEARMAAVNFSLAADDGLAPQRLAEADLILVGVSRVGKTPTALYLALHFGLAVANYPLTPDELARDALPGCLNAHLPRLRGLTLDPARLAAIRQARYPGSRYASLPQCRSELVAAEALFARHGVPVLDTTRMSVEEIAARLRQSLK
ncbi:MAG: kinase/pyrophosphorylase [Thiobacillus sp.]|nr:kinase/pyrophosphorylase [Thiobacillus sp.]